MIHVIPQRARYFGLKTMVSGRPHGGERKGGRKQGQGGAPQGSTSMMPASWILLHDVFGDVESLHSALVPHTASSMLLLECVKLLLHLLVVDPRALPYGSSLLLRGCRASVHQCARLDEGRAALARQLHLLLDLVVADLCARIALICALHGGRAQGHDEEEGSNPAGRGAEHRNGPV